jgi:L-lactate dehydrogenase complex protein LldG
VSSNPAREQVLGRIRAALGDVPEGERPEDVAVPREYRVGDPEDRAALVARFAERVADYRATVHQVAAAELPAALAEACRRREARRLVAPAGLELDAADGVLSGCALAIADTGTIVLDGGERQGRRTLTLLPDYHLCVVEAGQVVGSVPEALAALAPAARSGHPITFVSGPSATSDIELNRVEGVHGPRTLEVVIVTTG